MSSLTGTDYDNNSNVLNKLIANAAGKGITQLAKDYNFLYFQPDPNGYPTADVGCHAPSENDPSKSSVDMMPLNKLHTNESCKFNAALLQSKNKWTEQTKIKDWTASKIKPGLNENKVASDMGTNPKFFLAASGITKTINKNFNITNSTGGIYSCEWYGFFKPKSQTTPTTTTANQYTFSVECTNKFFIWIGDVAVNDYTALTSTLTNASTNPKTSIIFPILYNRLYPIRIQCNFQKNGDKFVLTIKDAKSILVSPEEVFVTYYNNDDSLFEKSMLYYSLTESSPELSAKGLYNCYVSNTNTDSVLKLKKNPNGYKYKIIWQLIPDSASALLNSTNVLKYLPASPTSAGSIATLSICNAGSSGGIVKSFSNPTDGGDINVSGNLALSDSGVLTIGSTTVTRSSSSADPTVAPNLDWKIYATSNTILASMDIKNIPLSGIQSGTVLLISENGSYKLEFLATGNLVLKQSMIACNGKNANNFNYSTITDNNSYYLYRVDADEKMNRMFMTSNNAKTLSPISYANNGFALSNVQGDYTNYADYFPPDDTSKEININTYKNTNPRIQTCKALCSNDLTCNYVYEYTKNADSTGATYCLKGTDANIPAQFIPKQPGSIYNKSKINVRNYQPNLPTGDTRNYIGGTTITTNYVPYQDYQLLVNDPFVVNDEFQIGYNGLDSELRNRLIINHNYINGTGQPLGQDPIMETFTITQKNGYQTSESVNAIGANPFKPESTPSSEKINLPTRITNQQINPLLGISANYSTLLDNINAKYTDISNNIDSYKVNRNNVLYVPNIKTSNPNYAANEKKRQYDFNGDSLAYNSYKPTISDAINQDLNILILQENQLYMLSAITIAALIIGAIYFGKE
uniref:PA14 domain-containing protein n=1 Tax=viral metagenome TaxID=1070528 RepID=A0A6C0JH74_9ZZZZ